MRFGLRSDFARVDEQLGLAGDRHDGEGQRHGIVGHVRSANVEQPADGIREGEHDGILAVLAQERL
jgi:hypothetical protein